MAKEGPRGGAASHAVKTDAEVQKQQPPSQLICGSKSLTLSCIYMAPQFLIRRMLLCLKHRGMLPLELHEKAKSFKGQMTVRPVL